MLKALTACLLLALFSNAPALAQDQSAPKNAEEQAIKDAANLMLARAQLVRSLAAEHLVFIESNADKGQVHVMDSAAQVMAYSLVCEDGGMDAKTLNDIANRTTLDIALLIENSPVAARIAELAEGQALGPRMVLVGDLSATTLMFMVGRRRGLFDALMTDFSHARFCGALGPDMRTRYNALKSALAD